MKKTDKKQGTKNTMKTKYLLLLLPLLAGCKEKPTECDGYQHYAPADARGAWKMYSPASLEDWNAYNSVSTTLNYFGPRFYAYDSTVSMHAGDTVLLCGYFRSQLSLLLEGGGMYYLVDDTTDVTSENILQGYASSPDTTRKAYVKAVLVACPMSRFLESYPYSNVSRCPAFNYYFDFDTILTYKD